MNRYVKNTKVVALVSIGVFSVSIALFVFFFMVVEKQKIEYREKRALEAQKVSHQESLKVLMKRLEETHDERETLVSRILKEEEVIDTLALIESLGREQGLILKTQSLTVEPVNETFETIVINISVDGSYSSLIHLLKLFETLPYQSTLDKVRISQDARNGVSSWHSSLELRITKFKSL